MHHCKVFWRPSSWLVVSDVKLVNTSLATNRLLGPWCNVKWCISWITLFFFQKTSRRIQTFIFRIRTSINRKPFCKHVNKICTNSTILQYPNLLHDLFLFSKRDLNVIQTCHHQGEAAKWIGDLLMFSAFWLWQWKCLSFSVSWWLQIKIAASDFRIGFQFLPINWCFHNRSMK